MRRAAPQPRSPGPAAGGGSARAATPHPARPHPHISRVYGHPGLYYSQSRRRPLLTAPHRPMHRRRRLGSRPQNTTRHATPRLASPRHATPRRTLKQSIVPLLPSVVTLAQPAFPIVTGEEYWRSIAPRCSAPSSIPLAATAQERRHTSRPAAGRRPPGHR